ncbi:MAG: serine/threonine protein kinase [Proteobacteria bacterium]|nr:serine/threonine protein kinase [Pseudomonadota bacterium]MCP4917510.1 serine/threonine protein kinase [Pseudomonadota bacterium]
MGQTAAIEQFGKYAILERVAQGGMAEIFKARMEGIGGFNRLFAIKRVLPGLSQNREYIDLLVDEAKVAGLLSHANIVQILDLGQVKGQYYVAMEYVHGQDLGRVLERCRERGITLPVPHAVFVLIEVLKGLEYAHNRQIMRGSTPVPLNIVHRDVSPSNVLLSFQGEVKLTDFGIAKASVKALETVSGVIKGKFDYMSPEQASAKEVDQRTDLFAAGVLFYEMLCGTHPFRQTGDLKTIAAIRAGEYQAPTFANPDVPYALEVILDRALSAEAGERYQTATEFKDALNRFFHDSGFIFSHTTLAAYLKGLFPQAAAPRRRERNKVLALKDQETRPIPIPMHQRMAQSAAKQPVDDIDERPTIPEMALPDEIRPTVPSDDVIDGPSVAFGPVDLDDSTFDAAGDTSSLNRQVLIAEVQFDEDSEDRPTSVDDESTLVQDSLMLTAPVDEWSEDVETVIRPNPTLDDDMLDELELDELTATRARPAPRVTERPVSVRTEPGPTRVAQAAPPPTSRPVLERPRPAAKMTRRTTMFILLGCLAALFVGFVLGIGVMAAVMAVRTPPPPSVVIDAPKGVTVTIDGKRADGGVSVPLAPGAHALTVDVPAPTPPADEE